MKLSKLTAIILILITIGLILDQYLTCGQIFNTNDVTGFFTSGLQHMHHEILMLLSIIGAGFFYYESDKFKKW